MVGRTVSVGLDVCGEKVMSYGLKAMSFPYTFLLTPFTFRNNANISPLIWLGITIPYYFFPSYLNTTLSLFTF